MCGIFFKRLQAAKLSSESREFVAMSIPEVSIVANVNGNDVMPWDGGGGEREKFNLEICFASFARKQFAFFRSFHSLDGNS